MTKEEAIKRIQTQLTVLQQENFRNKSSSGFKKWRRDTEVAIRNVFGQETYHLSEFTSIEFSPFAVSISDPEPALTHAFLGGLSEAKAILSSMIDEIENYWPDVEPQSPSTILSMIKQLCSRFHLVARQLRMRHDKRGTLKIQDEYDVQDLLHALLKLHFDDVRPEEWVPSLAGASARTDFLLKGTETVIEVKKTRQSLTVRDIADQLINDIMRYKTHPSCKTLVCFVYDPDGFIDNPHAIENDLSRVHDGLEVIVIVAPKGV